MKEPNDSVSSALDIALSVIQESSKAAPHVEVRLIEPNADIADPRYLVVVFRTHGLLVDKVQNRTLTIPLNVDWGPPEQREPLLIAKAIEVAQHHKLSAVYFTRRVNDVGVNTSAAAKTE